MNQSSGNNIFYPSQDVIDNATVKEYDELYRYSIENREKFWAEQAESLYWHKKWDKVLDDSNPPYKQILFITHLTGIKKLK